MRIAPAWIFPLTGVVGIHQSLAMGDGSETHPVALLRGHTQQLARLGIALTLCLAILLLALSLEFKHGVVLLALVLAMSGPAAWLYFLDGAERLFLIDCAGRVLRLRK